LRAARNLVESMNYLRGQVKGQYVYRTCGASDSENQAIDAEPYARSHARRAGGEREKRRTSDT
jgi:hypothetical protein